jgi:hypothetical protein
MSLFLDSQIYSVDLHIPIVMSATHYLDYCSFVINFQIGKYKSSNFLLLFQDIFCCFILGTFNFYMNFRMSFSIFAKIKPQGVDRDYTESVDQFDEYCYINKIKFSDSGCLILYWFVLWFLDLLVWFVLWTWFTSILWGSLLLYY